MEERISGINPALNGMLENGRLSGTKILHLTELRRIVDRIAGSSCVSDEEQQKLKERYGEIPAVITWGDYFQTEIASQFFDAEEDSFAKICDTVRFDLISSVQIFRDKPEEFFSMAERNGLEALGIPEENWDDEKKESAHLYILSGYYREMDLSKTVLSPEDLAWYEGFTPGSGAAAG